jgi:dipeptidyl aminopeptidase/acylaminoacyl peptidase
MEHDIRKSALYGEAEALYQSLRKPGSGQICDVVELHPAPDGRHAVFSGAMVATACSGPRTRICRVDLTSGDVRVLTFGPHTDRLPKYSPNGQSVAFLSDRLATGNYQLYLLDPETGAARATQSVEGWIEYLHWSPDGKQILLGVAGHGADLAGGQGAITSKKPAQELPTWMPLVDAGDENSRWRRLWLYDIESDRVRIVSELGRNIWEAVWCGNEAVAAVVSDGPGEGLWYTARLQIIRIQQGTGIDAHVPQAQLAWPACSPSGKHIALVEGLCSDRLLVAGDLRLIDTDSGKIRTLDTHDVDISCTEWRSEDELLVAGHRSFETVVGLYSAATDSFTEIWSSRDVTSGGYFATVAALKERGDCLLAGEGFTRAPEIGVVTTGKYRSIWSTNPGYSESVKAIAAVEAMTWRAPDGLEIQGWLLRPSSRPPYPVVMYVHGGPVWLLRPFWIGRRSAHILMLLRRGYAQFFPNPRGSAGRGQDFVRHVVGDMAGVDTYDYLSGLDSLVEQGIADPKRLGVTGASYGGFIAAWLITQDARFAAAVPVAPVINHVTEHLISNIPHFVSMFLADDYTRAGGKYFERSPIMHTHKVKTPTLSVCGALDRCTPPEEAIQFHNALLERGVRSVLVVYPQEGHGIRNWPAIADFSARLTAWFEEHMPAGASQ